MPEGSEVKKAGHAKGCEESSLMHAKAYGFRLVGVETVKAKP